MAIFKLRQSGNDISEAELVEASKTNIDLEEHLGRMGSGSKNNPGR